MRHNSLMRFGILMTVVSVLTACSDNATTSPDPVTESAASSDRGVSGGTTTTAGQPGRPGATPQRPATPKPTCRPDTGLTAEQIAKIRALKAAFDEAVAPDLRQIAQLEAEARAAVQAGAPRERIEVILAEIERLKAHVSELEQRLRQAINDVLTDEQRACIATAARKP